MNINDIYTLLEGRTPVIEFVSKYQSEFAKYEKEIAKNGRAVSVLVNDDFTFVFGENHFIYLCTLFMESKLAESQINYLVDCLIFSDRVEFSNYKLFNIVESFTDPSINGHLTYRIVQSYLTEIR